MVNASSYCDDVLKPQLARAVAEFYKILDIYCALCIQIPFIEAKILFARHIYRVAILLDGLLRRQLELQEHPTTSLRASARAEIDANAFLLEDPAIAVEMIQLFVRRADDTLLAILDNHRIYGHWVHRLLDEPTSELCVAGREFLSSAMNDLTLADAGTC
ncbi:hypothetical protein FJ976_19145 [Mesorhizobium sp. B1-1-9]|uniref:hypothetical protein n=1 Tax=Mesorhizobium sp. B1-1-9 TaxID=2589975 RepID=UPI001129B6FB|nr:hypothetical protein [Mesorhizobium sp. B1-1-9]TPN48519.1 hypothetical protein FJ976_19145 [Mesorhizobium sp. B1-1-9]